MLNFYLTLNRVQCALSFSVKKPLGYFQYLFSLETKVLIQVENRAYFVLCFFPVVCILMFARTEYILLVLGEGWSVCTYHGFHPCTCISLRFLLGAVIPGCKELVAGWLFIGDQPLLHRDRLDLYQHGRDVISSADCDRVHRQSSSQWLLGGVIRFYLFELRSTFRQLAFAIFKSQTSK